MVDELDLLSPLSPPLSRLLLVDVVDLAEGELDVVVVTAFGVDGDVSDLGGGDVILPGGTDDVSPASGAIQG